VTTGIPQFAVDGIHHRRSGSSHPAGARHAENRDHSQSGSTEITNDQSCANPFTLVLRREVTSKLHCFYIQRPPTERNASCRFRPRNARDTPPLQHAATRYPKTPYNAPSPAPPPRGQHPASQPPHRLRRQLGTSIAADDAGSRSLPQMPPVAAGQPRGSTASPESDDELCRQLKLAWNSRAREPPAHQHSLFRSLGIRMSADFPGDAFHPPRNGHSCYVHSTTWMSFPPPHGVVWGPGRGLMTQSYESSVAARRLPPHDTPQ